MILSRAPFPLISNPTQVLRAGMMKRQNRTAFGVDNNPTVLAHVPNSVLMVAHFWNTGVDHFSKAPRHLVCLNPAMKF